MSYSRTLGFVFGLVLALTLRPVKLVGQNSVILSNRLILWTAVHGHPAIHVDISGLCVLKNPQGLLHLFCGSVTYQNELVGFYLGFILDNTVSWDAYTE